MDEAERLIDEAWHHIEQDMTLNTPDERSNVTFTIIEVNANGVVILTESAQTEIPINRASFIEAIRYLQANAHDESNPCEITARKEDHAAGPFCRAIRIPNGRRTMISSYLVPILEHIGVVGMGRAQPNTVWII